MNISLKAPEDSKYVCKYCYTKNTENFKPNIYIYCIECEKLLKKYKRYLKNKEDYESEIAFLCDTCNKEGKRCKRCVKIQQDVQDLNFSKITELYCCEYCRVTDKNKFEIHRRHICRSCKNKKDNLKYNHDKSEEEIRKEIYDKKYLELLDEINMLKNRLTEIENKLNIEK